MALGAFLGGRAGHAAALAKTLKSEARIRAEGMRPLLRPHSPFCDSLLLCFGDTRLASHISITFLSAHSSHPVFRVSHSKLGSDTTFSRHLYLISFFLYRSASSLLLSTTGVVVTLPSNYAYLFIFSIRVQIL